MGVAAALQVLLLALLVLAREVLKMTAGLLLLLTLLTLLAVAVAAAALTAQPRRLQFPLLWLLMC